MSDPAPTFFERQYAAIRAHRLPIFLLLIALLTVAAATVGKLPFDNSIEVILPDGKARESVRFLTEASLADKVVISLEKKDENLSQEAFIEIANRLTSRLQSPVLTPLDAGTAASGMMENFQKLLALAPQLCQPEDLAKAGEAIRPEAVDKTVRSLYEDLAKPSSIFTAKLARQDPLGLYRSVLSRLERLSAANLYDVSMEAGHLFSRDRRNLLLVFSTPVSMTDSAGTRELVTHLQRETAALPASVQADVVCAHLHTFSNEQILRHDIHRTSWIGALAFLTIFAVVFRDWRSVAMLGIPVCAAFLALPLAAAIHGKLSYLIVGFGMVIVGISSDYGIYVYVVTRRTAAAAREIGGIARPMGLGLLTTLSVFVAFHFSGIDGYRQLATFAILSISLAYLAAIFLLPHLLGESRKSPLETPPPAPDSPSRQRMWICITALAAVAGIAMLLHGRFSADMTLLDGTSPAILSAEKRFEKTWSAGGTEQGIIAFTGTTYEEALQRSETFYDQAEKWPGVHLLSFSLLWRSEASRSQSLALWKDFWTPARIASVKESLLASGKRYGFSQSAFQPFFDRLDAPGDLREPLDNPFFSLLKDRFVRQTAAGFTVFSFFPDTGKETAIISSTVEKMPGGFCISRRLLTETLGQSIQKTIVSVVIVSLILVLGLNLLFSPTWRMALAALAPPLVAVPWALGVPALLHQTLNICHLTAAAVVFGLSVDYGIYMTDAIRRDRVRNGKTTIILTTATSISGAGVLLFTEHPVLYAIGITLTVGMLAGHITAIWGVPALMSIGAAPARNAGIKQAARIAAGLLLGIGLLAAPVTARAGTETISLTAVSHEPRPPARYEAVSAVVMQYRWFKFPALGAISVDTPARSFALVGLSQLGVSLFELREKDGQVKCRMPGKLLERNPRLATHAANDVRQMFFDLEPPREARQAPGNPLLFTRETPEGTVEYRLDPETRRTIEKRLLVPRRFWLGKSVEWVVRYENYTVRGNAAYPQTVRFKQRHFHYAITTQVKEMRIKS